MLLNRSSLDLATSNSLLKSALACAIPSLAALNLFKMSSNTSILFELAPTVGHNKKSNVNETEIILNSQSADFEVV